MRAQNTEGTAFWLTFMNNFGTPEGGEGLALKLIVSARQDAMLTVTNPQTGYSASFEVKANAIAEFIIPHEQGYTYRGGTVSQRGICVTSTCPVSLYASNFKEHTYDATIVLPLTALGTDYITQIFESDYGLKEVAVVATEDNTSLVITPHAATNRGQQAGLPFSVNLNTGETYMLQSGERGGHFSGTRVQSDKPVAVFSGDVCTNIPTENKACDHIVEQQMPVPMWGRHFALTKTKGQKGDIVLVTARDNATQVRINGTLATTLQALESYEFRLVDNSAFVETSGPAACYMYLEGAERNGFIGDPSSVHVSPVEQHVKQITFATFQTNISRTHYVNVVTTPAGAESMLLDGKNISDDFAPLTGNNDLMFAQIRISHGTHTLHCGAGGFTGHVYGLGDCESYAYTIGSAIRQLDGQILVDGEPRTGIESGETRCYKVPVVFAPHANVDFNTIEWDFGDGQKSAQNTVSHTYASAGTYHVEMRISNEDGKDTARTVLRLVETLYDTLRTTICDGETFTLGGQDFKAEGKYDINLTSAGGCDSLVTLYLSVAKNYETHENATFRTGSSYRWHNRWFREGGVYRDTLITSHGCDSIFILTLTEIEAAVEMTDTICWQPTYYFKGYDYPLPSVDEYRDREYIDYTLEYFDKDECEHYRMNLAIVPKEAGLYELYEEIQGGQTYDFFGELLSQSGTYTKTVSCAYNCVQEYVLHLSVRSFEIHKETAVLCHEDSVLFHDRYYSHPGVWRDTVFSEAGIEAVYELTLEDKRSHTELTISNVAAYDFNGKELTEEGTYRDTLNNAAGCDSIVTLHFIPKVVIETEVNVSNWCADEGMPEFRFSKYTQVKEVLFRFDDASRSAGMYDTLIAMPSDGIVSLPYTVRAGVYETDIDLLVHGETVRTLHVTFTLLYPSSVMEQAWNDMVVILTHDYNGGYDFTAFQWYENGTLLDGETHSYLYRPLVMGGEYSALLTAADGTQVMTCPLTATPQTDVSLYPTIATPKQQIQCFVTGNAELTVYDSMGRQVIRRHLESGANLVEAPEQPGLYAVSISEGENHMNKTYKLIVR